MYDVSNFKDNFYELCIVYIYLLNFNKNMNNVS